MRRAGYVVAHEGRQYDPDGRVTVADHDAHNRALSATQRAAYAVSGPARDVLYLSPAGLSTWMGELTLRVVSRATARRWSPFAGRWDTVVRGHAHAASGECYTFQAPGDGMYAKVRKVARCGRPGTAIGGGR